MFHGRMGYGSAGVAIGVGAEHWWVRQTLRPFFLRARSMYMSLAPMIPLNAKMAGLYAQGASPVAQLPLYVPWIMRGPAKVKSPKGQSKVCKGCRMLHVHNYNDSGPTSGEWGRKLYNADKNAPPPKKKQNGHQGSTIQARGGYAIVETSKTFPHSGAKFRGFSSSSSGRVPGNHLETAQNLSELVKTGCNPQVLHWPWLQYMVKPAIPVRRQKKGWAPS